MQVPNGYEPDAGQNQGLLLIWDRRFGAYQPETEKVRNGVATGFISHNSFTLVFNSLVKSSPFCAWHRQRKYDPL